MWSIKIGVVLVFLAFIYVGYHLLWQWVKDRFGVVRRDNLKAEKAKK